MQQQHYTPKYVSDMIVSTEYHHFKDTNTIVCCVKLYNGYCAVGESTCYDEDKFDITVGEDLAYKNATKKLRSLENYRTRANRHDLRSMGAGGNN